MIEAAKSEDDIPLETSIRDGAVPLESILCTEELRRRPLRPPDYEKENRALVALVRALADSPHTVLQTLAEKVVDGLQADSAGLSLLTKDEKRFDWAAIAGAWQPHIGGGTPRDFGPCGDVLDRNVPMLFTHWERRYPYLRAAIPLAEEGLLVPFYVNGKAVGTIWAIAHTIHRNFDAEDLRLLESLGRFASAAYQSLASIDDLKFQIAAREKAEAAVRELATGLEAKARRLVEANIIGIVIWNLEGQIIEANEAFLRIVGYSREDLLSGGVSWREITPDSWRAADKQALAELNATGSCEPFEKEYFRKDGSRVPVLVGPAWLEGSRDQGVAFVLNLTERKLAEDRLRRSEAYLTEAQRLSLTGSFGWNVSTGEIFWTDETYRIVGLDRGFKPTLEDVLQRVHPEDIARVREALDRGIQGGTDLDFEHRLLMSDGSVKYVRVVGRPSKQDASGNLEFAGAVTDITERKQLEGQLHEGQQRFRLLSESSLTGIYLIQEGRFRYVNPVMASMFGYTVEEVVDRLGPLDLTHPDDRHIVQENIRRRIEGEVEEIRYDFRGLRKDGSVFYIEVYGRRIEHGGRIGVIGTLLDITERKRSEEERWVHLWFLASMDQVNRAIQGTNDFEQMMSAVLDAVLTIFNCDRAWLTYPCDPEVLSWGVAMEHTRPEFAGASAFGLDLAIDPEIAKLFHTVLTSSTPVRFGSGSEQSMPAEIAKRFSIRSMIAMAIYPKGDKPYMLGLHQCSYPRVWTPQEERLFQEIGRRLGDALTSVLMFRNLGESERKLEDAQRLTHVGYWEHTPDTDLIMWSDETYRIFGLQPRTPIHLPQLLELIHPDDRQIVVQASMKAIRGGPRYNVEYRVIRPNGEVRLVHSQGDVMSDESGRTRRMFGTVQDITERKRAEQRLVLQHSVTRMLAEAATVEEVTPKILQTVCECLQWEIGLLWTIDRQAGVLCCVEIWQRESVKAPQFELISRQSTFMAGVGLPGRVWSSCEPAYISDAVHDANFPRAAIAAREGLHAAFGFPILLGSEVLGVMEFLSREIRQPERELLNMMAAIGSQLGQFIEGKRAEERLAKAQAELAHVTRLTTIGELTASIAHEVNQPLAAIVTNANACLRWLAGALSANLDEARDGIARIIKDGKRAADVIARIRALVRKTDPKKVWLDINQTVQDIVFLAQSEAVRQGVTVRMELAAGLPLVLGDRVQLQQVMLNLVMNGIEAMSPIIDRSRDLLISSGKYESDQIIIAVQDSGTGIDHQNLDKIFNPFYTTKAQGMGMGLAISRSIVENHGGYLWASPNDGPGATFQFTLRVGSKEDEPMIKLPV